MYANIGKLDFIKTENVYTCPGWGGSVGWASSCKLKSCWFHSQAGRVPGLCSAPARVLTEAESTHRRFSHTLLFLSLSLSLPSSLQKKKGKEKSLFWKDTVKRIKRQAMDLELRVYQKEPFLSPSLPSCLLPGPCVGRVFLWPQVLENFMFLTLVSISYNFIHLICKIDCIIITT